MPRAPTVPSHAAAARPLYGQLRPRPNGPPRGQIVANQRARLHGAMVEAVADHGYGTTSVAELCRLAGVSKRTFYEQFQNKEACLLASCEIVLGGLVAHAEQAARAAQEPRARLESVLSALLGAIAERPEDARLALLHAPAAGRLVRGRCEQTRVALAQTVASALGPAQPSGHLPRPIARGIVAGVERVIRGVLADPATGELPGSLQESLTRWALSYCAAGVGALQSAAATPAAQSPHVRAPRSAQSRDPRARALHAAAGIFVREGGERLTMARVAIEAGIDQAALSERYAGPEECLRDAVELLSLETLVGALAAFPRSGARPADACVAIAALARQLSEQATTRTLLFSPRVAPQEPPPVGARGEPLLLALIDALWGGLRRTSSSAAHRTATVGALTEVIARHGRHGSRDALARESGTLAILALAPAVSLDALGTVLGAPQAVRLTPSNGS